MEINISNLQKAYREVTVLNIPELSLHSGELIGLVGNNGAGKTTLMRLILDLIKANTGTVYSNGNLVNVDPVWKEYTGSFLDSSFLIDFYTPEEYFAFIADAYGIPQQEMTERLRHYESLMNGEILGTGKVLNEFSMGNRQKVGIIGAMVINPKVLILDEPFNYIDPTSQKIVASLIQQMNRELGTTCLISSHSLSSINDICTRILLLEKGIMKMDHPHTPGNEDKELEDYFSIAVNSME